MPSDLRPTCYGLKTNKWSNYESVKCDHFHDRWVHLKTVMKYVPSDGEFPRDITSMQE